MPRVSVTTFVPVVMRYDGSTMPFGRKANELHTPKRNPKSARFGSPAGDNLFRKSRRRSPFCGDRKSRTIESAHEPSGKRTKPPGNSTEIFDEAVRPPL